MLTDISEEGVAGWTREKWRGGWMFVISSVYVFVLYINACACGCVRWIVEGREKKHCLEETLLHSVYSRTNSLQIK